MRQKFVISRDGPDQKLNIKEYAVIETKVKKPVTSMPQDMKFTFFCEETYESEDILGSIAVGFKSLVAILRTHNFYPIEPYANQIAKTVIKLYSTSDNDPVELFFDDLDLVSLNVKTA